MSSFGEGESIAKALELYLDTTSVWHDGRVYKIKHYVDSTKSLEIHVYKDHPPDHFHVISKQRGINARFCLHTLEYLSTKTGICSPKVVRQVQEFFRENPQALQNLKLKHGQMQTT